MKNDIYYREIIISIMFDICNISNFSISYYFFCELDKIRNNTKNTKLLSQLKNLSNNVKSVLIKDKLI
jgi:hypothetical protein